MQGVFLQTHATFAIDGIDQVFTGNTNLRQGSEYIPRCRRRPSRWLLLVTHGGFHGGTQLLILVLEKRREMRGKIGENGLKESVHCDTDACLSCSGSASALEGIKQEGIGLVGGQSCRRETPVHRDLRFPSKALSRLTGKLLILSVIFAVKNRKKRGRQVFVSVSSTTSYLRRSLGLQPPPLVS